MYSIPDLSDFAGSICIPETRRSNQGLFLVSSLGSALPHFRVRITFARLVFAADEYSAATKAFYDAERAEFIGKINSVPGAC